MWVVAVEGPSERRQRCRGTGREAAECLCERSYLKSRHLTLNPERADKCWAVRARDRDPCWGGLGTCRARAPSAGLAPCRCRLVLPGERGQAADPRFLPGSAAGT